MCNFLPSRRDWLYASIRPWFNGRRRRRRSLSRDEEEMFHVIKKRCLIRMEIEETIGKFGFSFFFFSLSTFFKESKNRVSEWKEDFFLGMLLFVGGNEQKESSQTEKIGAFNPIIILRLRTATCGMRREKKRKRERAKEKREREKKNSFRIHAKILCGISFFSVAKSLMRSGKKRKE